MLPGAGSKPGSSRFHLFSHFFTTFPLSNSGSPYITVSSVSGIKAMPHNGSTYMVQCCDVEVQLFELKVSQRGNVECKIVELTFC
jgi:hypothetical protein